MFKPRRWVKQGLHCIQDYQHGSTLVMATVTQDREAPVSPCKPSCMNSTQRQIYRLVLTVWNLASITASRAVAIMRLFPTSFLTM